MEFSISRERHGNHDKEIREKHVIEARVRKTDVSSIKDFIELFLLSRACNVVRS